MNKTNLSYIKFYNVNHYNKRYVLDIQYKKKKVKNFYLKDGIIKIKINLPNLNCNFCKLNSECSHIYFIYYEFYKIPINIIPILFCNNFNEYTNQIFKTNDFDINKFYDSCVSYLNSNDCCYCLDKLGSDTNLWKCNNCNNLIHYKCIKEWINKKNECPLCKQIIKKESIFN